MINLISMYAIGNTNYRIRLTRTLGYTRGWIRCLQRVRIPCRPATSSMSHFSRKQNNRQSKSLCQQRHHYRWRSEQFRPVLIAYSLLAQRGLYQTNCVCIRFPFFILSPLHLLSKYFLEYKTYKKGISVLYLCRV
jgi:hypothetical protein